MISTWIRRSSCCPSSRVSPICSGDKSAIGRVIVPMSYVIGGLPSGVSSTLIVHFIWAALQCHGADYFTPAPPTYVPLPSSRKTHTRYRMTPDCPHMGKGHNPHRYIGRIIAYLEVGRQQVRVVLDAL